MHDRRFSNWRPELLSCKYWQNTVAIFCSVIGQTSSQQFRSGRHKIDRTNRLVRARSFFNLARPARNKRHAVTTLVDIEFFSTIDITAIVTSERKLVVIEIRSGRLSIIAGKKDKRILQAIVFRNRIHNLSYDAINQEHEVAICRSIAFPDKFRRRDDRSMRSRQSAIEEERLIAPRLALDVLRRTIRKIRQRIHMFKILP